MSKTIKFECTRRNVSPREFYTYCKKQAAKKSIGLEMWISFNDFIKPVENTEIKKDNEINIIKPYKTQFYLKNDYNFIIEFNFDNDKKGTGYCYIEIIEEDKIEDSKEETKTVETVEEKQEEETIIIDEPTEINGQKLNIKSLNNANIKKPAKLQKVTLKIINNNKELDEYTIKKIIKNIILNQFLISDLKVDYIKINTDYTIEVKMSNTEWIAKEFITYDIFGNIKLFPDDMELYLI